MSGLLSGPSSSDTRPAASLGGAPRHVVSGIVRGGLLGTPIMGALVCASSNVTGAQLTHSATTGRNGTFSLVVPSPNVLVAAQFGETSSAPVYGFGNQLAIHLDELFTAKLLIECPRGQPLANATVRYPRFLDNIVGETGTSGRASVCVSPSDYLAVKHAEYPIVANIIIKERISYQRVRMHGGYSVRGRVLSSFGSAVPGVRVTVWSKQKAHDVEGVVTYVEGKLESLTDLDGRYSIHGLVMGGSRQVSVSAEGFADRTDEFFVDEPALSSGEASVPDITVSVGASARVVVRVNDHLASGLIRWRSEYGNGLAYLAGGECSLGGVTVGPVVFDFVSSEGSEADGRLTEDIHEGHNEVLWNIDSKEVRLLGRLVGSQVEGFIVQAELREVGRKPAYLLSDRRTDESGQFELRIYGCLDDIVEYSLVGRPDKLEAVVDGSSVTLRRTSE